MISWRGPSPEAARDADDLAVVRRRLKTMSIQGDPLPFYIPSEHYIHYGSSELVSRISVAGRSDWRAVFIFAGGLYRLSEILSAASSGRSGWEWLRKRRISWVRHSLPSLDG